MVCLFVCLFVCWFVGLFVCLLVCLFVCLFVGLFVCLFVGWLVCLFVCLFVCWFVCLFVCLFVFVSSPVPPFTSFSDCPFAIFLVPSVPLTCAHTVEYHDALSLGTLPVITARNTYIGGGLLAELGYDIETAQNVITNLQDDLWINRLTRIVVLEFVVFEPATNLFAFSRYTFESLPTGGILPSYKIDPISFIGGASSFSTIFIVCYVLIILILIYSIYHEIKEMRQLKCDYFKDIWNFIEWAFISFTIATIVIFFFKSEYTR